MLAILHIDWREADIFLANSRHNRHLNGEQIVNGWIFLTFGRRGSPKKYNEEANESD